MHLAVLETSVVLKGMAEHVQAGDYVSFFSKAAVWF